ncbi:MAG: DUF3667 domain-containing protein [Gemmatimonadaceae bacterium]
MPDDGPSHSLKPSSEVSSNRCHNCGAPIVGPFCSSCGQRDIPPYPSLRELVVDAVSEFSGWDGRLASTLRALVQRPGMLTCEFLAGRRARYISPIRLYLTASVLYFLLAASAPDIRLESGKTTFAGGRLGVSVGTTGVSTSRPERVANTATKALENQQALTTAERDSALAAIAHAPGVMQPVLRRAVEDPRGFKRRIAETMPRMLFALLPIFAAILALFYRGRKYPEHLYFAIHLHAFIFLALGVTAALKFTQSAVLVAVSSALALIWIPIYATLAFRRVYGGGLGRTLMKEVAIGVIYGITSVIAFIVMIYWVSVAA